MTRLRQILHPTDFSSASSGAYRHAVELAKAKRAELLLVHVLTPTWSSWGRTGERVFRASSRDSIASHVVAVSPCPVLTVRGK